MTRLNLIPPSELMDQHLFAEWREIKMVPKSLARSLRARRPDDVLAMVRPAFTLNTGHVSFFYDKGEYLRERYQALTRELDNRGFNYNPEAKLDPEGIFDSLPHKFQKNYTPTREALQIVRDRIALRIYERPNWYRKYGKIV